MIFDRYIGRVSYRSLAEDVGLRCANPTYAFDIKAWVINLPCWFKTSAFRLKGAPRNKRSDVALSGAD